MYLWEYKTTKCICLKKMKVNPNSSDKIHLRNWCFTPNLQYNCDYTLIFINFVILPLLFTSLRDFTPIQHDFAPALTVDKE